jgi:hypothetical protein
MLRVALVLALATLGLAAVSEASAATWGPEETIAPLGPPGMGIPVPAYAAPGLLARQDARGDVVVVWTEDVEGLPASDVEHVELAFKPAGQPWKPVERIGTAGSVLADAQIDAGGDVTVAFITEPPGLDGGEALNVVTRAADGAYTASQTLQPATDQLSRVALGGLGVDDAGDVLVIYDVQDGQPWSAFRPAGGAWQAPVSLQSVPYDGGLGVGGPVMFPDGSALLFQAPQDPDLQPSGPAERRFSPQTGWAPPVPMSAPANALFGPNTLVLPTGEIVTFVTDAVGRSIEAASLAPGSTAWGAFATIATIPEGSRAGTLRFAADAAGEIFLSYSVEPEAGIESVTTMVEVRAADGNWGQPQELVTATGASGDPSLAVAGDGRAAIETVVNTTDPDHPIGLGLFGRDPGSASWAPMAAPFAPLPGATVFGGPGHELVDVSRTQALLPGQQLLSTSLSASLLTTATSGVTPSTAAPAASKSRKTAVAHASIALTGKAGCRSERRACRTTRVVRLAVHVPKGMTRARLTVQRLRGGRWRGVRLLSLHLVKGAVRVRLPLGRLRLSTAPVHDTRVHPWVAYVIVR